MKKYLPYLIIAFLLFGLAWMPTHAFAADNISAIDAGTGLTKFDSGLKPIARSLVNAGKIIVSIMTTVALLMIASGIQEGKKTVWSIILGIGLALNFASFFYSVFGTYFHGDVTTAQITQYQFDLKGENDGAVDLLSGFMNNYTKNVIVPGAMAIQGPILKLLGILTLIDATMQLSLDLVSGDKVKFLITVCLRAGLYIFLITNWLYGIDIMNAFEAGFQEIGLLAGGASANTELKPDSIVNNAIVIFHAIWDSAHFSIGSLGLSFVNLISIVCIIACLFLTAIEMFMVRIEFYTMALIALPLLPFFGMIKQLRFLAEKAIGAVLNLMIKVAVISFISTIACPLLKSFADKIAATSAPFTQIGIILQTVLAALVIFFLTKRIPNLVQGYLTGNPSLGGGMVQMAATGLSAAGGAAGAVRAASNMRGGGNAMRSVGSGNRMSQMGGTAANLMKLAYLQNPMTCGFQSAKSSLSKQMDDRMDNRSNSPDNTKLPNPIGYAAKMPVKAVSETERRVKAAMEVIKKYNK
jgi:type IV secretion system protein TrbL